jgi:hypothetical protein
VFRAQQNQEHQDDEEGEMGVIVCSHHQYFRGHIGNNPMHDACMLVQGGLKNLKMMKVYETAGEGEANQFMHFCFLSKLQSCLVLNLCICALMQGWG